jgi:SAM-dependent methyltransferase
MPGYLAKYSGLALAALRQEGWWHTAADLLAEVLFDLRHGTETTLPREPEPGDSSTVALRDAVQYQGANPRVTRALLDALPPAARAARFVDFGCGKGRVLLLAAEAGFTQLTGVEFDPALAQAARWNLLRRARPGSTSRSEVLTMDATRCAIPEEPAVLFFYNPFGGETLRQVVANIARRARASREPLWVVYLNPKGLAVFTAAGLAVSHETRRDGRLMGVVLTPGGNDGHGKADARRA